MTLWNPDARRATGDLSAGPCRQLSDGPETGRSANSTVLEYRSHPDFVKPPTRRKAIRLTITDESLP